MEISNQVIVRKYIPNIRVQHQVTLKRKTEMEKHSPNKIRIIPITVVVQGLNAQKFLERSNVFPGQYLVL